MVIFAGGKFHEKCWQDISRRGNFHDTTPISFIKVYGFYFRVGVIFAKKTEARKKRKLPPHENFHVYSMPFSNENIASYILLGLLYNAHQHHEPMSCQISFTSLNFILNFKRYHCFYTISKKRYNEAADHTIWPGQKF